MIRAVYICSPLSGNVSENLENVKRYVRYVVKCGMAPVIPHFYAMFFDSKNENERNLDIKAGLELIFHCDELWIFGDEVTKGMHKEIHNAKMLNIKIRYITDYDIEKLGGDMV